jgi:hypothetical protein
MIITRFVTRIVRYPCNLLARARPHSPVSVYDPALSYEVDIMAFQDLYGARTQYYSCTDLLQFGCGFQYLEQ